MRGRIRYIGVDEALAKIRASLDIRPDSEGCSIDVAYGRVLAEDVVSPIDVPRFDSSHRDGYAIRSQDTVGATRDVPAVLRVVGAVFPGVGSPHRVRSGEAVRISTGAFLPDGADSVVMVEEVREGEGGAVEVFREIGAGEHVLKAGADFKRGETVLSRGHVLRAQDIAMLAVLGLGRVAVARRPRVAIVSVGDELTLSIDDAPPGKVSASHRFLVSNMVSRAGGDPIDLGIAPDDLAEIRTKLEEGLERADIVLTVAGCSLGEKDLVDDAVNALGEPGILVHGLTRGPGRVSGLGVVQGKPIIMLPGLCQSLMVGFHVFALPLIRRMSGLSSDHDYDHIVKASVGERLLIKGPARFEKVVFVRLKKTSTGYVAVPSMGESALLSVLVASDGFFIAPKGRKTMDVEDEVDVHIIPGFSHLYM